MFFFTEKLLTVTSGEAFQRVVKGEVEPPFQGSL